jgi:hypothetical protein
MVFGSTPINRAYRLETSPIGSGTQRDAGDSLEAVETRDSMAARGTVEEAKAGWKRAYEASPKPKHGGGLDSSCPPARFTLCPCSGLRTGKKASPAF